MPDAHSEDGTLVMPDEAALIVKSDGDIKMCLPDYPDQEDLPFHVMVLTAVWLKIREDKDWAENLIDEVFSDDE